MYDLTLIPNTYLNRYENFHTYNFHRNFCLCTFEYVKAGSFIEPFIDTKLKNIFFCGNDPAEEITNELIEIFHKHKLWLMKWNCLDLETTNLNEGLVILNQVSKKDLSTILQSKGIQMSLKYNIWLISTSSNSTESILEFLLHGQQFLKIGLNAKIFVIDQMSNVTIVIGNGGFETTIKVVNENILRILYVSLKLTV